MAINGVPPGVMLFVFTAQAGSREVQALDEGELLWVSVTAAAAGIGQAVNDLDWVGGKPDLLRLALDARERKRPFFIHRKGDR